MSLPQAQAPVADPRAPRPPGAHSSRRIALRLFATCWLVYALHFATNTVREIYPALSLGDHLSFDVSEYLGLHPDVFAIPGRGAFINNNPGASILAAVPYAAARPLIDRVVRRVERARAAFSGPEPEYDTIYPMARDFYRRARARGLDVKFGLAAAVMQVLLMAPLSALSAVVMFYLLLALVQSVRAAALLSLLYAFATPVFYRTAQLNQNLLVAHAALLAFALLWRPGHEPSSPQPARYLLAGLLCGWAVVCDYSGVIVVPVLAIYAGARRRSLPAAGKSPRDLPYFAAGIALGATVLMGYQWWCFGNPFYPAQHYMPPARFTHMGYRGVDWPRLDLLWDTAFSPRFGLFVSAPLLLLALYPPAWRRHRLVGQREAWCIGIFSLLFFLFCGANQYGRMQFNSGVRHIVPVSPFLFLIAAGTLLRLPAVLAAGAGVAATYWSWCLAMYRDVEQGRGVVESFLHITFAGFRLPWLATLQGMGYVPRQLSAAPLLVLCGAALWILWRRRDTSGPAAARAGRGLAQDLCIAGGALFVAVALLPSTVIERALLGGSSRTLSWGPVLFRALLAAHGAALLLAAARRWQWTPAGQRRGKPLPATPARLSPPVSTRSWLLLIGLSFVALALRFYRLGSDLWFDEVLTLVEFARPPLGEILTRFPSQNQHMLYSVLAHAALGVFGESAWALRLPAVLFGLGSLWALFVLGRRLVGTREALLATAIMTVSYHHVWFSQNARGYTALLFFATLAAWLWLEARQRNAWGWWLGYAAAVSLGMWSHLTMAFVAVSHAGLEAASLLHRERRREAQATPVKLAPAAVAFALSGTLALQLYALSLPEFLRTALHEVSLRSEWTNPAWVITESLRSLRAGFSGAAIVAGGSVLAGAGWLSIWRRDGVAAVSMVLPAVLGGATMLALGHNLWPRFFFFSMGFALLVAVRGAMCTPALLLGAVSRRRGSERLAARAGTALVFLMLAASAASLPRCYALPKQNFTGAREYVEQHRQPGDGIVAVGLAGVAYQRYYAPHWLVAQSEAELQKARQAYRRLWLVYTLPIQLQSYRPEIWQAIAQDFAVVRTFPGTLGGGSVYVCREQEPRAANSERRDK